MSAGLRLYWLHNIPSPYRNHRFEWMAKVFPSLGIDFEVLFMAWTQPDRFWRFRPEDLRYPWSMHGGVPLPSIGGHNAHFNAGLLRRLRRDKPEMLVVGGWESPTAVLAPFACGGRTIRIMESESNFDSGRTGPLFRRLKGTVIRRYDGYIVPGPRARALVEWLDPVSKTKPFVELPNLVNESVYVEGIDRERARRAEIRRELGIRDKTALWVCPARLETFKGLHLFLPLLEGVPGVTLLVAGEGSLRGELQATIDAKNLPVRLVGQKNEAEMVAMYAAADLFVLPSLSDPSPLSAVEASAAALPLLVSTRIGNVDDVVVEGENGWRYDPGAPQAFAGTVRHIASLSVEELAAMGRRSRERHARRFDSRTCVTRVGEFFLDLSERSRRSTGGAA
jgi:glycosyltransferase involved in cell wall biosynthesis